MKRYSMIAALLLGVFLTLFFLVEALNVALVKEPSSWLGQAGVLTGFVGVCLLVTDVGLPVPSSMVLVAHGALFGVKVGTLLSLVGSTGATLVGFGIGRRSKPLIVRLTKSGERVGQPRLCSVGCAGDSGYASDTALGRNRRHPGWHFFTRMGAYNTSRTRGVAACSPTFRHGWSGYCQLPQQSLTVASPSDKRWHLLASRPSGNNTV